MFLKVLPKVPFVFQFKINHSKIVEELRGELKCVLYSKIITTLGLGAKTNVGYGQFVQDNQEVLKDAKTDKSQDVIINEGIKLKDIKVGDILDGIVSDLSSGVSFDLKISDIKFKTKLLNASSKDFLINQMIKVSVDKVGNPMIFSIKND